MNKLFLALTICLMLLIQSVYAEDAAANKFTLSTNAFLDEGILPVLYTCDGKDISPLLEWTGAPDKTQTFAFILVDPKAAKGSFYHWVLYNIPKNISSLPSTENKLPAGVIVGKNSLGNTQYKGPCPPKGAAHSYIFTLYALDTKLNLPAGADAQALLAAMDKHILAKTQLTATYSRWIK